MARLKIDGDWVLEWSTRYADEELGALEQKLLGPIHETVRSQGFFTKPQLTAAAEWKSARQRARIASNSGE